MKKILFIDRDGTIISEPEDEQIDSFEKLDFLPGAISNLGKIAKEMDFELVMVTNQDGLGTGSFPEDIFWPVHNKMLRILENEGVVFSEILIDRSFPSDHAPTRKPGTALLAHYLKGEYDLANSFVIGDRDSDVQLAKNLSAKSIHITKTRTEADLCTESWNEIYQFLKGRPRTSEIQRKTNETNILIHLNLDGSGKSDISTGLGFFDHMLEQLCRHGGLDLTIHVDGDLHIDEHHTIEDTGLALGNAFNEALGSRKGISRYGFLLPMDEALSQVAIDFGGRPYLVWDAEFKREKIGEMPTEMFKHFFKSFCDTSRSNLNIRVEGENEHHKIEAIFKAWAKAIKMAVQQNNDGQLPSTKGTL